MMSCMLHCVCHDRLFNNMTANMTGYFDERSCRNEHNGVKFRKYCTEDKINIYMTDMTDYIRIIRLYIFLRVHILKPYICVYNRSYRSYRSMIMFFSFFFKNNNSPDTLFDRWLKNRSNYRSFFRLFRLDFRIKTV